MPSCTSAKHFLSERFSFHVSGISYCNLGPLPLILLLQNSRKSLQHLHNASLGSAVTSCSVLFMLDKLSSHSPCLYTMCSSLPFSVACTALEQACQYIPVEAAVQMTVMAHWCLLASSRSESPHYHILGDTNTKVCKNKESGQQFQVLTVF